MISYKDYPQVPEDIIADVLHSIGNYANTFDSVNQIAADTETVNKFNSQRPVFTDNTLGFPFEQSAEYYPDTAVFSFIDAPNSLKEWVKENIGPYPVNIQIMDSGNYVMPHIDEIRTVALNYLITTGNGITCIYEPTEQYKDYIVGPQMVFPKERLVKVDEKTIDNKRWHTLDVTRIHGVENLNGSRVSITVSLLDRTLL